ncbi:MAG: hypothetical protein FWC62_05865 [Firmicutes bacterium]|nr:hypothetical protein [Bacillota bacterium]
MAYSILEALFNGKIIPWERRGIQTPEYKELRKKIETGRQYFTEKMSSDDYLRFQELEALYSDADSEEEINVYAHGFTLGVLLMVEAMSKIKDIINA